jgi:hypothetical protein
MNQEIQANDWFNNLTPEQQEQWLRGQEVYQKQFKNIQCDDQECDCHHSDFEVIP